jgi:hypothetical protein
MRVERVSLDTELCGREKVVEERKYEGWKV